jgi:hypothetical protein
VSSPLERSVRRRRFSMRSRKRKTGLEGWGPG